MTNAEALWASLTPSDTHLLDQDGADVNTTRRMLWQLEIGPVPLSSSIVCTCGEPRCVNPDHAEVSEPRSAGETKDGTRLTPEMKTYFDAVRLISNARGFPDDVWMFAGYAAGLMLLARAEIKYGHFGHREVREYAKGVRTFRRMLESWEFMTGVSVDDAMALAATLRTEPTPVIGAPEYPEPPSQRVLSEDVAALMKVRH